MKQYRYLVSFSSRSGMGSAYVARTSKLDGFDKLVEFANSGIIILTKKILPKNLDG